MGEVHIHPCVLCQPFVVAHLRAWSYVIERRICDSKRLNIWVKASAMLHFKLESAICTPTESLRVLVMDDEKIIADAPSMILLKTKVHSAYAVYCAESAIIVGERM
jgi:hypothetical protein